MPTFDLDTLASAGDHFFELFDLEPRDHGDLVPKRPGEHPPCQLGSCVGTWTSEEPEQGRGLRPDNNDNSNSPQTKDRKTEPQLQTPKEILIWILETLFSRFLKTNIKSTHQI